MAKTNSNKIENVIYYIGDKHLDELLAQGADIRLLRTKQGDTPLVDALLDQDEARINQYLSNVDPNIENYRGEKALSLAIQHSNLWTYIPLLLAQGAKADIDYPTSNSFRDKNHAPIENMIDMFYCYDENPEAYDKGLIEVLKHTNQKEYRREDTAPLIQLALRNIAPGNPALFDEFVRHYDFNVRNVEQNNALQQIIGLYCFDSEIYESILKHHSLELKTLLSHKNKDKETALHIYFKIFNEDEEEQETLPDSIFLLYQHYLNVFYPTVKDEVKWNKFINSKTAEDSTISTYIEQTFEFEQEKFKTIFEKHILNLKITTVDSQDLAVHKKTKSILKI